MKIKEGFYKRNNGSNALIKVVGEHESGDLLCVWAFDAGKPFRYHPFEFKNEFEEVTQEYVDSIERHCCPEHAGIPSVFAYSVDDENPNPDRWDISDGFRKCSFCGSIHPEDLILLIKEHGFGIIESTDKRYKWYIHINNEMYKFYRYHEDEKFVEDYNKLLFAERSQIFFENENTNANNITFRLL